MKISIYVRGDELGEPRVVFNFYFDHTGSEARVVVEEQKFGEDPSLERLGIIQMRELKNFAKAVANL